MLIQEYQALTGRFTNPFPSYSLVWFGEPAEEE
jgi:hypothetical protein